MIKPKMLHAFFEHCKRRNRGLGDYFQNTAIGQIILAILLAVNVNEKVYHSLTN